MKILLYAIFDVAGMALFATGALWLTQDKALFVSGFPASAAQAWVATVGGLLLMFWAATRILRELISRPADNTEKGI